MDYLFSATFKKSIACFLNKKKDNDNHYSKTDESGTSLQCHSHQATSLALLQVHTISQCLMMEHRSLLMPHLIAGLWMPHFLKKMAGQHDFLFGYLCEVPTKTDITE